MTATDADLLASFARNRDEASFRALAQRHFALIFHTALRRTGNRPLAEEITQNVFCAVARKAAILAHKPGSFPAWLHRSTLFECTTAMRKEISQQRRLHGAHLEQEVLLPSAHSLEHDSSLWQQALPHLDQALDKISESDRRVLLLHFFESLPFPRIAVLMGKSPAAVQKQSVRALDKLAGLLRPKGVIVPVTVLTAGLAAESAKAAPLGLIPAFTTHALTTTTGMSGLSVMIATHQKILIPCSLLLLAAPLVIQQQAIARVGQEISKIQAENTTHEVSTFLNGSAPRQQLLSPILNLQELRREALRAARSPLLGFNLGRKLAGTEAHRLAALLEETRTAVIPAGQSSDLKSLLADALSRKDPELAMRSLAAADGLTSPVASPAFRLWLRSDLPAARDWMVEQQRTPKYASLLSQGPSGGLAKPYEFRRLLFYDGPDGEALPSWSFVDSQPLLSLQASLFNELISVGAAEAQGFLDSIPSGTWQLNILESALMEARRPLTDTAAASALTLLHELTPEENRDAYLAYLTAAALWRKGGTLDNVNPLLHAAEGRGETEKLFIAETAAKQYLIARGYPAASSVATNAQAWLLKVLPEQAADLWKKILASADAEQSATAENALSTIRKLNLGDDSIIWTMRGASFRPGPQTQEALELAEKVQDPAKRESLIKYINDPTKR